VRNEYGYHGVAVEVSLGEPSRLGIEGPAPVVKAVVTNVDAGKQDVHFTRGGDYRGGRRERWRAVLTDERGRVVRDSNFMSLIGGGIASLGSFPSAKSMRTGTPSICGATSPPPALASTACSSPITMKSISPKSRIWTA
jgi:hypothetical protein